ncbi:MAG: sigma-54-dependent transcriptional regulator [bacterium]
MSERLLIVDDEKTLQESLQRVFTKEGYDVDVADSAESAIEKLNTNVYHVVITDIILPGMDGIELLRQIKEKQPEQIVIIITAYASIDTAVKSLRLGAYDYIVKPIIHEEIKQIVKNALKQHTLQNENTLLKKQIEKEYAFTHIVAKSDSMKGIVEQLKKIADTKSNVLILGETGTGKELVARAIHFNSNRSDKPFIPINCSAIPENLLESELFGYVKGAFTGAFSTKNGLLVQADKGSVFLDEIGDLSMPLQSKLLRVLEDKEVRPLGGTQSVKIDVRFIFATNRDIEKMVKEGTFRADLFYRINVIVIKIPPLRDRKEDIEPLVKYIIDNYSKELGKHIEKIDEKAMDCIKSYHWYGNVRELQNVIERAILLADNGIIRLEHLPENVREKGSLMQDALRDKLSIEAYTRAFIMKYQNDYNEKQLAEMLGITRKALWEKRKRWGIERK